MNYLLRLHPHIRLAILLGLSLCVHLAILLAFSWPPSGARHTAPANRISALTVILPDSQTDPLITRKAVQPPPEPSDANTRQPDNKSAHSDKGLSLSIAPHYFSLAELDERPFIIRDIPPNPPELKDFPQGGKLVLRLWIDTEGRVVNAEPVLSELPPAFTDSARSGFQDARFAPGRKHGQAVASVLNVTIHYAPQQ